MDYAKHYEKLIVRARNRLLDGYVELHHVVPRCMGGTNERSNLAQLTPEEHYVAHQLLCKMYPEKSGLLYALALMTGSPTGRRSNNKLYGWIKKKLAADPVAKARTSRIHKGRVKSDEERAHISEAGRKRARRKMSPEACANYRAASLKKWAERRANGTHLEIAQKIREKRIQNGSYQFSAEHRANIGKAGKGRVISEEQRAKISAALKGKSKPPRPKKEKPPKPQPTEAVLAERQALRSAHCSAWQKGRTLPPEHKAKIAAGLAKAYANGMRRARGKLPDDDVRAIRALLQQPGITQKQIAARYGISQGALSELKSGKSYQHVK